MRAVVLVALLSAALLVSLGEAAPVVPEPDLTFLATLCNNSIYTYLPFDRDSFCLNVQDAASNPMPAFLFWPDSTLNAMHALLIFLDSRTKDNVVI